MNARATEGPWTPGPWQVGFPDGSGIVDDSWGRKSGAYVLAGETAVVAGGYDDYGIPVGILKAEDARLIAAAPDLAAAAQAVIDQWDTPNWKLTESTGELIGRFRAALAAARGGT